MHRFDRQRRLLACGIAALAGYVDAAGFLAANGYFVSFMSGNTTRLGVDLATRGAKALTPALLIAGFVVGVTLGAIAAERSGNRRKTAVLALSTLLIAAGGLAHALGSTRGFLAGSVLAMGAVNNTFRRNGEVAVGVTYMTGALVRAGQGLAAMLLKSPMSGAWASLALWACLAAGAIIGAATTRLNPAIAPWAAVAGGVTLLLAAWRIERAAP